MVPRRGRICISGILSWRGNLSEDSFINKAAFQNRFKAPVKKASMSGNILVIFTVFMGGLLISILYFFFEMHNYMTWLKRFYCRCAFKCADWKISVKTKFCTGGTLWSKRLLKSVFILWSLVEMDIQHSITSFRIQCTQISNRDPMCLLTIYKVNGSITVFMTDLMKVLINQIKRVCLSRNSSSFLAFLCLILLTIFFLLPTL